MGEVTNVTPDALAQVVARFFLFGARQVVVKLQGNGNYTVFADG